MAPKLILYHYTEKSAEGTKHFYVANKLSFDAEQLASAPIVETARKIPASRFLGEAPKAMYARYAHHEVFDSPGEPLVHRQRRPYPYVWRKATGSVKGFEEGGGSEASSITEFTNIFRAFTAQQNSLKPALRFQRKQKSISPRPGWTGGRPTPSRI